MVKITQLLQFDKKIVLASKSPRRIKLLRELGFDITVMPADIDEDISNKLLPNEYVMKLSLQKAMSIADKLDFPALVIGADTTVWLNNEYLNKPGSKDEAYQILRKLSGNTHKVFTGIAIIDTENDTVISDFQETDVTFRKLEDDEIYAYIESESPMDKAGAYGIQDDFGAVFVSHIVGCYYNIVGLPVQLLYTKLRELSNAAKKQ